jgi:hypothetical protein
MRGSSRFALACVLFLTALAASLFLLTRSSLRPVATWMQPDSVSYDQWGPYYLTVAEADIDWRGFPLSVRRRYFVYAGRDSGKPSYGHAVDYSFNNGLADIDDYIRSCSVGWTAEGVTLTEPDGHLLFIPSTAFTGGR